jgi:hypothetical protein
MINISHRGNINGRNPEKENTKKYIEKALKYGFDCEIDLWLINNNFFLGHDEPKEKCKFEWLYKHRKKLWIHCKNISCLEILNKEEFNCFFHNTDDVVLTSKNYLWTYPGKQLTYNSIGLFFDKKPENFNYPCAGICSDYIESYYIKPYYYLEV